MALTSILKAHQRDFHPVVPYDPASDRLYPFDFTEGNTVLTTELVDDIDAFAGYITNTLEKNKARYGFGGYGEHRTIYTRSRHFDAAKDSTGDEPRRLHLGIDIWAPAGTKVMAPLDGILHSFAFNNNLGDYGATIILTHQLDGVGFHTLYGHLSLNSLKNLHEGKNVRKGDVIAEFGMRFENGNWPPHLHFQLISDMQDWKGDYPGVCRYSEREKWLANCPDPNLILQMQTAVPTWPA